MDWRRTRAQAADRLTDALQLDVRFYGRSFVWLSLGHASGVIRGIATTFLMARWLDPTILGQFRYTLALFGMASIFSMTGMSSAVIRGVAQGDTIIARLALKRILTIAPLGTLALFLAAGERWIAGEPTVAAALAVAAVAFLPSSASGLYGSILTGKEKIKELARLVIASNLLYAIAFVIVLRIDRGLVAIACAYFGFDILLRGFLTWREFRTLPRAGQGGTHLTLGDHLSGVGVLQAIAGQLDQILIQRFAGYHTLALYSVATVIPEQIKDMVNSVSGTLLQRLSRHKNTPGHVRATRRHFWLAVVGSGVIVASYALIAPIIIPWLFPAYTAAVPLSIVYALGLIAMPAVIGVYFFQAHGDLRRLWKFSAVSAILQIVTNIGLIPFFGSWGAVWSRTVTRLAGLPLGYPAATETSSSPASRTKA